jgi:hypothetical protein
MPFVCRSGGAAGKLGAWRRLLIGTHHSSATSRRRCPRQLLRTVVPMDDAPGDPNTGRPPDVPRRRPDLLLAHASGAVSLVCMLHCWYVSTGVAVEPAAASVCAELATSLGTRKRH